MNQQKLHFFIYKRKGLLAALPVLASVVVLVPFEPIGMMFPPSMYTGGLSLRAACPPTP